MQETANRAVQQDIPIMQLMNDSSDGEEDIAKRFLNMLYLPCPSREYLWNNASESNKRILRKNLEDIFDKLKTGKA